MPRVVRDLEARLNVEADRMLRWGLYGRYNAGEQTRWVRVVAEPDCGHILPPAWRRAKKYSGLGKDFASYYVQSPRETTVWAALQATDAAALWAGGQIVWRSGPAWTVSRRPGRPPSAPACGSPTTPRPSGRGGMQK